MQQIKKTFYFSDELLKFGNSVVNAGYMPGSGIFEYWFANHFNFFKDNLIYIANALFHYSLVISCCFFIKSKNKIIKIMYCILLILLLPIFANTMFHSLYAEPLIALMFSLILLFIVKSKMNIKNSIILMILSCGFMLIKSTIIAFIPIFLLLILFDKRESLKVKLNFLLPSLTSILCIYFSWNIYLCLNRLNTPWDCSFINIENIVNFVTGNAAAYQYEGALNFLKSFFYTKEYYIKLYNCKISFSVFFVVTFIFSLFIMYVFSFTKWETLSLSALSRYIQVITIINVTICFYTFFSYNNKNKIINCLKIILPVIIILLGYNGKNYYEIQRNSIKKWNKTFIEKYEELEKINFQKNDKILVITKKINDINGHREIETYKIRYKLIPVKVNLMDKTIVSQDEIKDKLLCGYTYIYFLNSQDEVIEQFNFLSKEKLQNNKLYKISNL